MGEQVARFGIHFDGPITVEHRVSIRVLSKTYEHMQRAIDRAFLIEHYGEVWKHARLTDEQYAETEFIAEYPREGGIHLDAIREGAGAIIDRISASIAPIFERSIQQGLDDYAGLAQQHADRLEFVRARGRVVQTFDQLTENPPAGWSEAYSNKSVIKEVDQLVSQIAPERLAGSTVELSLAGNRPFQRYEFDAQRAKRFHQLSSRRDLGEAIRADVIIRSLDRGNRYTKPNAKILNRATNREVALHLRTLDDCDTLHRYHNGQPVQLYVCPIVEALGFDIHGGDLMFIAVA